jgi:2,3-bisphosphoglycerate-dependent phosphoglycerate mutase
VVNSWRLNERHYGALVGLPKEEAGATLGAANVMQWRKSWRIAPPPMSRADVYELNMCEHAQPKTITTEKGRQSVVR